MKRHTLRHSAHKALVLAGALTIVGFASPVLHADNSPVVHADNTPGPHAVNKRNPSGTPLDTLLQTRLWADVPEARDFVREHRPSVDSLDYQPTARTDPKRPAPRTKTELEALRAELEAGIAHNEASAKANGRAKLAANAKKAKIEGAGSN